MLSLNESIKQKFFGPGQDWLKIIIIIGVLLTGIVIAPEAAMQRSRGLALIALYFLAISLMFLLRWPILGILGIVIGCFLVPFSGPSNLNISELGIALMLALWLFDMIVIKREIKFVRSKTIYPLILFTLISLLSFGIGQLPWYTFARHAPMNAQLGGLFIFLLSFGAFILVPHIIRDQAGLEWLTWIFLSIGAIYIIGNLIHAPVNRFIQDGATGSVFWVWILVIPFSQAVFNRRLHSVWRAILLGLVLVFLYVAIVRDSSWKSGYLPPLAGMAVIIALRLKRRAWLLLPIGLILAWFVVREAIATDQYSYSTRLDAWRIVLEISKANPILGLGFGNYYWYTPLFPIRGWSVVFNSHSQYVDLIAQTGLAGLACFLWVFWSIGRLGWWLRERVPEGFAKAYVYGVLGGLVGTLVAGVLVDWVLPFVYNIGLSGFRASVLGWIFLGGLVSIEQIVRRQSVSESVVEFIPE